MSIGFLLIVIIVALVCLLLGMSISNRNAHAPRHDAQHHHRAGGWGLMLGLIFGVPLLIGLCLVLSWVAVDSRSTRYQPDEMQNTTVARKDAFVTYPAADSDREMRLVTGPSPVTDSEQPPLTTAEGGSSVPESRSPETAATQVETGEVTQAVAAAASSELQQTPAYEYVQPVAAQTKIQHAPLRMVPLLVGGLVAVAFLIMAGVWIAHRRQHWTISGMARSTVKSLWAVPMLAAIGWVGYLIWPQLSIEPLVRNDNYDPARHEFKRYVDEAQSQFLVVTSGLPPWVTNGITSENELVHVPVHGGWRESEAEARNEAQAQALHTIREDFALTYPTSEDWRIDAELKDLHAVSAETSESKLFNFGGTEIPMYRTHLLVELSDEVRDGLVERWTPQLQQFRMGMLLTFSGLLTLVCFSGASCLSLDLRTSGNYRRWLRSAAVLVVLAGAAAAQVVLNSLWFHYSV